MALTELNRTHTGPNAPVEQTRTADDRLEDRDDSLPINTSTSKEDNTMPQLIEPTTPDAQRKIIRQSLDEIATEVATALRDAQLDFPVFLTVPNSGDSLATMASPLDPSDGDWSHASAIVCRIIGGRLCGRSLHCAVANATMGAAEVMAETGSEE
jgi:hypothetical protein